MANILYDAANTTVTLNGKVFTDLAQGDAVKIEFPNDKSSKTKGINKSSVIKKRMDGDEAKVTIKVLKASSDDVFLNTMLNQDGLIIINGSIKTNFTRDNTSGIDSYALENGTIVGHPADTKNNVDGEEVMEYVINFVSALRMI